MKLTENMRKDGLKITQSQTENLFSKLMDLKEVHLAKLHLSILPKTINMADNLLLIKAIDQLHHHNMEQQLLKEM